jgi:hypothetical protein
MLGDERCEPPLRLRELPFAACAVTATRLVPGDRYVDEALEEVFLGGIGRSPDVLEGLVRLEVLAAAHLFETTQ